MADPVVDPADLALFMGMDPIDQARAEFLISKAQGLCEAVVTPLPPGADTVVLDVAARAYRQPQPIAQQSVGPYSVSYGTSSGGLYLTSANQATLRRLSGSGGAFTIDVMPATAGQSLPWWDTGQPSPVWDVPS